MRKSMATFSRNLDWNLLKTFHEIVQSEGVESGQPHAWS